MYRAQHLALAWQAVERGELVLGGLLDDHMQGMLLFEADSEAVPVAFAKADPYVANGLVTKWRVRAWHTVVGQRAAQPIRLG